MNEENPWDGMENIEVVEGSVEPFAMHEVEKALRIKNGKASEPTGMFYTEARASDCKNSSRLIFLIEII